MAVSVLCLSRFAGGALAAAALLAILMSVPAVRPVSAEILEFRDPTKAPPSWVQFARLVRYRFEEWIAADDAIAARFRVYLKVHKGKSDGPPATLTVRVWVNPDGTIDRVSFPEFADAGATKDLRTILIRGNIGEAPPAEMLQPIHLRLSLNPKN
jgi:hypothetical protein